MVHRILTFKYASQIFGVIDRSPYRQTHADAYKQTDTQKDTDRDWKAERDQRAFTSKRFSFSP